MRLPQIKDRHPLQMQPQLNPKRPIKAQFQAEPLDKFRIGRLGLTSNDIGYIARCQLQQKELQHHDDRQNQEGLAQASQQVARRR